MNIIEMNDGRKVDYALRKTKLTFADGALTIDLARYQRDYTVTKDIMADGDGNLLVGANGRYYVAQVEIPPIEYEETVVEAEAMAARITDLKVAAAGAASSVEAAKKRLAAAESEGDGENQDGGTETRTTVERTAKPLNTDEVTLRLWSVAGFDIY